MTKLIAFRFQQPSFERQKVYVLAIAVSFAIDELLSLVDDFLLSIDDAYTCYSLTRIIE